MEWKWKGPKDGGITQSLMVKFLEDPYCFVLYYGLGLEERTQPEPNMVWGNCFHKLLEHVLPMGKRISELTEAEEKELLEIVRQEHANYPGADQLTIYSTLNMIDLYDDRYKLQYTSLETEKEFETPHYTGTNDVTLMGKIDGIGYCSDSHTAHLIEHKSKGRFDPIKFLGEIQTDLQLNVYLHALSRSNSIPVSGVIYDNILIPDSQWNIPPRKMHERIQSYAERLYHRENYGKFPVAKKSFAWVFQNFLPIDQFNIPEYFDHTVNPIIDQICDLYEYVSRPSFDLYKPQWNKLFFRKPLRAFDPSKTDQFEKSFYNHLIGNTSLEELTPTDKLFKELKIGQ